MLRDGRPARYAYGHAQPVPTMTPDGLVDGPTAGHDPDADRDIFTRHRPRLQLPAEASFPPPRAPPHQKSRSYPCRADGSIPRAAAPRAWDPAPTRRFAAY